VKNLCKIISLTALSLSGFSCASFFSNRQPNATSVTVSSDLISQGLPRTQYYENLGMGYSDGGDTDKAADLFRLAILHDPNNFSARIKLSDEYHKQGLDFLAARQLTDVLKVQSANQTALHKLGRLYFEAKIFSEAKPIYTKLLQVNPNDAAAAWALFFIAKNEHQLLEADQNLSYIAKLNPNDNSVILQRAELLRLQGEFEAENSLLTKAYEENPNQLDVVAALSDSQLFLGRWQQPYTILKRYNDTNSFNARISEKLAFASVQVADYELALQQYDLQKQVHPLLTLIDLRKAHVYFLMQRYDLAEQTYIENLKEKDSDEAKYYLSKIYQLTNRFDQSAQLLKSVESTSEYFGVAQIEVANIKKEKDFKAALDGLAQAHDLRPDLIDVAKALADMLIAEHQFNQAMVILEDGVIAYPDDEELRLKVAYTYYQLDNKQGFEEQMNEAIKINPKNSEIYSALAQLWFVKNKKSSEVEFFAQKALELKSKNINLKPLLAWALLDQNKSAQAIKLFEECYEQNPDEYFYAKSLADVYHYAYINSKADEFSKKALTLQSNIGLSAILQNKATDKVSELINNDPERARVPASLENY